MDAFINWFDMNGYAAWVWSAYALWAAAFLWLVAGTLGGRKRVFAQLRDQQRRAEMKLAQTSSAKQENSELPQ